MAFAAPALVTLALVWLALMALRLAFLAFHFRDLDRLWYDFKRRGLVFQLARGLDFLTWIAFGVAAVLALWGINAQTPDRLTRVFVAWLGFLLLERLPVHRFPRTNVPGALDDALAGLATNLFLAITGASVATVLAALYFLWRS